MPIEQLEQDVRAHAKTITELVQAEARRQTNEAANLQLANLKEQYLDDRLDRIEASIKAVYNLGKWLLGAAGSTLLVAVIGFALKGGPFG